MHNSVPCSLIAILKLLLPYECLNVIPLDSIINNCRPTGCSLPTAWVVAAISPVYTMQPVVKPVWQPVVSCIQTVNRLSKPFDNRFDNRVEGIAVRSTRLSNRVWQPLEQTVAVRSTQLWTGCIVYTNIQPVVKPVWQPVGFGCLFTQYSRLSNRLYNRLYRVNGILLKHSRYYKHLRRSLDIKAMNMAHNLRPRKPYTVGPQYVRPQV